MAVYQIGSLPLWRVPRVVGTITRRDTLEGLDRSQGFPCDIVELRLDLAGPDTPGWPDRCRAIEAAGYPVIFTLRSAAEGGQWTAAEADRRPLFEEALPAVSALDVEYGSQLAAPLCAQAATLNKPVIASFHDFERTPALEKLQAVVDGMLGLSAAIPKIATLIRENRDIETLRSLLSWNTGRPMCVIGMGGRGRGTRTSFPALGSCLTYGFIDGESAPGQLPAAELVRHLEDHMPSFRADWAERHPAAE